MSHPSFYRQALEDISSTLVPHLQENKNRYLVAQEKHLETYRKLVYLDLPRENPILSAEGRMEILTHLQDHYPKYISDIVYGFIDVFRYVKDKTELLKTFELIVRSKFPSDCRFKVVSSLKCYEYFSEAHELYKYLCMDLNSDALHRIEACKLIYAAGIPEERDLVQECLMDLIAPDGKDSSKRRFDLITSFFSRTGLKTATTSRTLISHYDEELLSGVLVAFFYEETNDTREVIVAGGMLLQMQVPNEEKESICQVLLDIARDERHTENARGDAADFVKNHSPIEKFVLEADHLLKEVIGFAGLKTASSFIGRQRMIYNNSQNVHNDETFARVLDFLKDTLVCTDQMIIQTLDQVRRLVKEKFTDRPKQLRALKALHRIDIDTTTFTSKKITLADTLVNVWKVIAETEDPIDKSLMQELLLDELYEMGDTCTSGHSIRLVNVLSARTSAEPVVKISYHDQIVANVAGRVSRLLSDADDATQDAIAVSFAPNPDPEELSVAQNWRDSRLPLVHDELYQEFVVGGFVNATEFEASFEEATKVWNF
jgi:hypothetical protein